MPAAPATPTALEQVPPWFRGMDANGDGEVSAREFLGPTGRFSGLDVNGDGFLSPVEAGS
jgi:hypothetical protein